MLSTFAVAKREALRRAQLEWGGKIKGNTLRPIAPSVSDLVSETENICRTRGEWFVVSTEFKEERHVECGLASVGLIPYLPMEPRLQQHGRGKVRVVDYPIMAGYLFVKCHGDSEEWHKVMATRGVRSILGSCATSKPLAVPEEAIMVMRAVEARKAETELRRIERMEAVEVAKRGGRSGLIWHFSKGDMVKIQRGPFAAFYAELIAPVDIHDRVRILVSLFGRTTITELSAHDIEAA